MLSVTQRIATISQPQGGYIPNELFLQTQYEDYKELLPIHTEDKNLLALQGTAVDYLTRFMLSADKQKAFHISILGAKKLDDAYENNEAGIHITELLEKITGLDDDSIRIACQIVGYDVAYRMSIRFYKDVDTIVVPDEMVVNIRVMVNRCLEFLKTVGPVISDELTFEGGYTKLVSSGDGDYLTADTLIDFKVSIKPFSNKWSLQLLMYYLLGIHSVHPEYQSISQLCVFNPYENKSYIIQLTAVSDETKYKVSHDVLGYRMVDNPYGIPFIKTDYSTWREVNGTDDSVVYNFMANRMKLGIKFDSRKYKDGIHKIALNEYWYCLGETDNEYLYALRPTFRYVDHILMIKKNGYLMFLSVSNKGKLGILNGGRVKSASFSAQYYFDNMERYVSAVLFSFSKYWNTLRVISDQLKSLSPSEKGLRARYALEKVEYKELYGEDVGSYSEWYRNKGKDYRLSGRIHGCIVDIDTMNHIYVNPYDGTITPYYALSMFDKDVYINLKSLLADQKPEFLESLETLAIESSKRSLALVNETFKPVLVAFDDEISKNTKKEYSYDMYAISNRLKPLQKIYDHKLIQVWYDDILNDDKLLLEDKYLIKKKRKSMKNKYVGQSMLQKGNRTATVIEYRNYDDIDVVFEDGYRVEHIKTEKWKRGLIVHPDVKKEVRKPNIEKQKQTLQQSKKNKYIGLTKRMNCGMNATVIDYIDCYHLKIQFEDGTIKSNVRSDHFATGNVAVVKKAPKEIMQHKSVTTSEKHIEFSNTAHRKKELKEFKSTKKIHLAEQVSTEEILTNDNRGMFENDSVVNLTKCDDKLSFEEIKNKYINMRKTMNDGSKAMVIKVKNRRNVTVQFEDGAIVSTVSINRFLNGLVKHP